MKPEITQSSQKHDTKHKIRLSYTKRTYILYFLYTVVRKVKPRKSSWTQIRDTDLYSETDSIKHDFDLNNQTLND